MRYTKAKKLKKEDSLLISPRHYLWKEYNFLKVVCEKRSLGANCMQCNNKVALSLPRILILQIGPTNKLVHVAYGNK